jgi:hypothetical protein
MSAWRRQAVERLPEFRAVIESAATPMALWVELVLRFEDAVRLGDEGLVRRFFAYAEWCWDAAPGQATEARTAAVCAFYEHLPLVRGLGDQLHHHLPRQRFLAIQDAFRHHLGEAEFARFRDNYLRQARG